MTNELMIGDLVMASTYEEEVDDEVFHPARITAISSIHELFDGNWNIEWLDDCASESCADLEPILLTEEILKANDWKNKTGEFKHSGLQSVVKWLGGVNRWHPKRLEDSFCLVSLSDGSFGLLVMSRLITIHYVHELQHALRMCGLNGMANNFIVKHDT